jgi:hypothetical protein
VTSGTLAFDHKITYTVSTAKHSQMTYIFLFAFRAIDDILFCRATLFDLASRKVRKLSSHNKGNVDLEMMISSHLGKPAPKQAWSVRGPYMGRISPEYTVNQPIRGLIYEYT